MLTTARMGRPAARGFLPSVNAACTNASLTKGGVHQMLGFATMRNTEALPKLEKSTSLGLPLTFESPSVAHPRNAARLSSTLCAAEPASSAVTAQQPFAGQSVPDSVGSTGAAATTLEASQQRSVTSQVASKGLVFEFSIFWVLSAWKSIGIGLIRNTFYTFRPVVFFFGMGYMVKFAFFLMGAPMLVSFYSAWLFEVGYNLMQCFLSVIFLTQLAYMDMSFRGRMRPMINLAKKRCCDAAKALKGKVM